SFDAVARAPARDRGSSSGRLWRRAHLCRVVYARRSRSGRPCRAGKAHIWRARAVTAAAAVDARASGAGAPLLRVQGLHKSFGGVRAVSDISVEVPSGSIFAIIGPNGAGKSTLLNLISGIYQPDSGSLSFDGHNLSGMPSHRRVRLGLARTF